LGKRARVYVPVADAPPSAVRIEAASFGALGPGQRLTLRLNDRDVWTGVLPNGPVDVDLPRESWRRGGNFLDLEFTLAGRPADLQPGSGDTRELAAAVTALTFRW
jgi:hypothetical protein